ncbi:MAG: 3D domain-containing protein [Acidobacteria bacterium]|nr:3D domain-containing protein [Acidobacteriota bacterium]
MKLFVRGGVGLAAALFAGFLIFDAQPLSALTNPSPQPAQQERQEKKEPAGTTKQIQAEPQGAQSETGELVGAVTAAPPAEGAKPAETRTAPLTAPQVYVATSYSLRGRGASGLGVRKGTIAADPRVLPYGTRVHLDAGPYSGEYLVTDTGTAIKGRKIDVWVPTYREACRFGRRNVKLSVLSYGGKAKRKK